MKQEGPSERAVRADVPSGTLKTYGFDMHCYSREFVMGKRELTWPSNAKK